MNPERFLGEDPSPGDLVSIDEIVAVLRDAVVVLAETRHRVDDAVGPESIWQGSEVEPIVDGLTGLSARLRTLEEAVVAFAGAWQEWRAGVATRRDMTAELVEEMSQLAGADDAGPRREDVRQRANDVQTRHEQGAADLVRASEDLLATVSRERGAHGDGERLAVALHRGFSGLRESIDQWVNEVSDEIRRTTGSLDDVAEVTAVVPQLVGIGARSEGVSSQRAWQIAAQAPASYRLQAALRRDWSDAPSPALHTASFDAPAQQKTPGRSIAERLRGLAGGRGGDSE